jgi:hypothetical protein
MRKKLIDFIKGSFNNFLTEHGALLEKIKKKLFLYSLIFVDLITLVFLLFVFSWFIFYFGFEIDLIDYLDEILAFCIWLVKFFYHLFKLFLYFVAK